MEHIAHAHQILEQRGIRHGEFYIQHFQRRSFFTAVDGVQLLGHSRNTCSFSILIRLVVHIHGAAAAQNAYHLEIVVASAARFPSFGKLAAPEMLCIRSSVFPFPSPLSTMIGIQQRHAQSGTPAKNNYNIPKKV